MDPNPTWPGFWMALVPTLAIIGHAFASWLRDRKSQQDLTQVKHQVNGDYDALKKKLEASEADNQRLKDRLKAMHDNDWPG